MFVILIFVFLGDEVHNSKERIKDSEDLEIASGDRNFRPDKGHTKRSKKKASFEEYRPGIFKIILLQCSVQVN